MAGYIVLSVLILIVCVLLILLVLVQNSKGGGLTSTFSSSNQVLGVKKTADFLEKSTWTLAIALLVLTLSTVFVLPRTTTVSDANSSTLDYLRKNPDAKPVQFQPAPGQTAPAAAPAAAEAPAAPAEAPAAPAVPAK